MLWTLPARAQLPIVAGRKRMFAAERISAASWRLIQSADAGATVQPVADSDEPEVLPPPEVEVVAVAGVESLDTEPSLPLVPAFAAGVSAPESGFEGAFVLADRSFLAQPEPLKWSAGAVNALRRVPSAPQAGQKRGPGAAMPWITSVRSPQFEHR
jgi:hypothetical protein